MSFAPEKWRGVRLLIVEDEYFLAQDLADHFQSLGAKVVGPAGTVADALSLLGLHEVEGAVLDVNLRGERVYPVADALIQYNQRRKQKGLYTENDEGHSVRLVSYANQQDEASAS